MNFDNSTLKKKLIINIIIYISNSNPSDDNNKK